MATDSPDEAQEMNKKLAGKVMDALQDSITAGDFGEASMVTSMLCVVELLDTEGHSRLNVIISDERLTTNLGLVNYAAIVIGSQVGGGNHP